MFFFLFLIYLISQLYIIIRHIVSMLYKLANPVKQLNISIILKGKRFFLQIINLKM